MNALELLKNDHEKVKTLLTKLTDTTTRANKTRSELLKKIRKEILIHATIEEEIFYPTFRNADGTEHREMVFEAKEEHRAVEKLVLPDLEKTSVDSDQFSGRAKVLKELIEHHAEEEEEEMFPAARKALSDDELEALGAQLEQRKRELESRL